MFVSVFTKKNNAWMIKKKYKMENKLYEEKNPADYTTHID